MRYDLDDGVWNYPLWMYGIETSHSYFLNRDRDFTFRLCDGEKPKQFDIKVKLVGERVEEEYTFQLYYEGKAKNLEIIHLVKANTTVKL